MRLRDELALGLGLTDERPSGLKKGYFPHWEFNVYGNEMDPRFQKMFNRGSGGELDGKASAVHSSSMLAYNFFHWVSEKHPLEWQIAGVKCTFANVFFEVRMKTLIHSNIPANMDVVLVGESACRERIFLFLESKFTEHFYSKKFDLSESYEKPCKYYPGADEVWPDIIKKVRGNYSNRTEDGYYDGIKQNICHLIALGNLFHDDNAIRYLNEENPEFEFRKGDTVIFSNIIFRPQSKFSIDAPRCDEYEKLLKDFWELEDLANVLSGIKHVAKGYLTYSDLWGECGDQFPQELRRYLQRRYMDFAYPLVE